MIMKTYKVIFAIFLLSPAIFLGCGSSDTGVGGEAASTLRKADSQGGDSGGVVRQTPTLSARDTLGEAKAVATRQGPDGLEVDLTRVGFAGDLMTVELRYRNPTANEIWLDTFSIEQVSFIDDATSKRYGVVKDQSGQYMASPLSGGKEYINPHYVKERGYSIVWFKFPAPPPSTQTISINIPKVSPFDGIRIQR
jgi:hypothetical protein